MAATWKNKTENYNRSRNSDRDAAGRETRKVATAKPAAKKPAPAKASAAPSSSSGSSQGGPARTRNLSQSKGGPARDDSKKVARKSTSGGPARNNRAQTKGGPARYSSTKPASGTGRKASGIGSDARYTQETGAMGQKKTRFESQRRVSKKPVGYR